MTWNLWSGKNWKDVVSFVKKEKIDVMGFQEVDNHLERTRLVNIPQKIARAPKYHVAYSASVDRPATGKFAGGQFGNCVVSKYPFVKTQRHFLSAPSEWDGTALTEPRALLEKKIRVNGRVWRIMPVHLGYSPRFQTTAIKLRQTRKVIAVIRKNRKTPTVLLGDFNFLPENREIRQIKRYLTDVDETNSLKTWTMHDFDYRGWKVPAGLRYKTDYVFVSKGIRHHAPRIDRNGISDHVPVIVELDA